MKNLKQIAHDWWQKQTTLTADITSFEAGYTAAMESMEWRPVDFGFGNPEDPRFDAPLIFRYEYEYKGKLTGEIVYEFHPNSDSLVERLCGSCPNYTPLDWKPL